MQANNPRLLRKRLLLIALAGAFNMGTALAQVASGTTGIDASGNYEKEVQACRSGQSQQNLETCLREARHAKSERTAGTAQGSASALQGNALSRCEALSGEDKAACQVRVLGHGSESGSVAGGGVLRSVETQVVSVGAAAVPNAPPTVTPAVAVPAPSR